MEKAVGLWIDHEKAVIVFVAGKEAETKLISSNIVAKPQPKISVTDKSETAR